MLAPTRPFAPAHPAVPIRPPVLTQPFHITVACAGERWRVIVGGELDLLSGAELTGVAGILAAAHAADLDLDLGEVTFIDTAGWEAVEEARQRIADAGGSSAVVAAGPAVRRYQSLVAALTSRLPESNLPLVEQS